MTSRTCGDVVAYSDVEFKPFIEFDTAEMRRINQANCNLQWNTKKTENDQMVAEGLQK